ncbi:MAG: MFS transporter [Moraxellaceae bacterium]|nr:MFS transporter [Moraxellaceae bacterium]
MTHAPRAALPPARIRNFVNFSTGQGISAIGTWAQKTAVGWLVWELTHSPAWVGAIALSDLIAALWVAPLAGVVTDRSNPYRLLLTTQTLMIVLTLLLWGVVANGLATPWLLLGWAILDATVQGFNQPVRMVAIGSLAPPERMSQAIATNSIAANLARSIGPAIAGVVMLKGDVADVFLINAVSFAAMLGAVHYVRRWLDRPGLVDASASVLSDMASGFAYVRRTPEIATLFFLTLAFALLARPFTELFPALAGEVFKGGPQTLGMLMSAQGVGALVGASWMLKKRGRDALVRITFAAAVGIALALIAFASTRWLALGVATMALAGLFHVVCNIGMQSMAQTMSAPNMRGRVMALYGLIFRAGPALGAFLIGVLAHWIGLQWLIGTAAAIFGLLVLRFIPTVRRVYALAPAGAR